MLVSFTAHSSTDLQSFCVLKSHWVMQADQLGHSFFVFKDLNKDIKVLYKRQHRGYGLLEPQ